MLRLIRAQLEEPRFEWQLIHIVQFIILFDFEVLPDIQLLRRRSLHLANLHQISILQSKARTRSLRIYDPNFIIEFAFGFELEMFLSKDVTKTIHLLFGLGFVLGDRWLDSG